jgi:hypothetical protein
MLTAQRQCCRCTLQTKHAAERRSTRDDAVVLHSGQISCHGCRTFFQVPDGHCCMGSACSRVGVSPTGFMAIATGFNTGGGTEHNCWQGMIPAHRQCCQHTLQTKHAGPHTMMRVGRPVLHLVLIIAAPSSTCLSGTAAWAVLHLRAGRSLAG